MTLVPLGATFGTLPVACLVDRFGRKVALVITNFLTIISAVIMSLSVLITAHVFIFFTRFFVGICMGLISTIVPLYLGEISPKSLRGGMIMMVLVFFVLGVLLGQILCLQNVFGTQKGIPVLLSLFTVMPLIQILLLPFFPESPRYLFIQKKDEDGARKALKKLRDRNDVEDEIKELHQEDLAEKAEKKINPLKLLFKTPKLQQEVITIVVLIIGEKFDGIHAVYSYMEEIFMIVGLGPKETPFALLGITFVFFISTVAAVYFAKSKGYRNLLLIGFGICCIVSALMTMTLEMQTVYPVMAYFTLLLMSTFIFGHSIGPGPIPYLFVVDLFLQSSRSSAFVIAGFLQWFLTLLVGLVFIYVETKLGNYTYLIACPINMAVFIYIFKLVPEIKNKTFVDIRKLIEIQKSKNIHLKKRTVK
ncbi:solute carrier family 2, facilitated glucose transporter member 5-like [Rhineura floridana]|uniref:solute carrier family 2, facilitated glucose transporter member 5-like n=1 Tax=Rhineura floridana TaxID=261503 RepID=UPI002AC811C5|nr:solute carrier family 2, facilitated glucose transporter member 5-like [Rhineura floridana]